MKKLSIFLTILAFLGLAACGTTDGKTGREGYKNYGEKVEDTKIVSFIRHNFRSDPLISNTLIHIAVDRGIVQLSGFVPNHQEADLAVLKARNTSGVKDVINNIIVLSSAEYASKRGNAERYNTAR